MAQGRPRQIQLGFGPQMTGGREIRFLEQVHVRGINRRGLRLELVAGVAIALAMPALAAAQGVATTTTLTAGTLSGCTQALTVTVSETASGNPVASATVNINDAFNGGGSGQVASVKTDAQGTVSTSVCLQPGNHNLSAAFSATSADLGLSAALELNIAFEPLVSNVAPGSSTGAMTLTAGQAGTATVTVTPSLDFVDSITASNTPAFITLSCSGLSDMANCNFTPQNVEIDPGQNGGVTSDMVIQTYAASSSLKPASKPGQSAEPIAWALILPGIFGLGGLARGARRRRFLGRLLLVALVGLVTLLGTTGCNPLYNYEHHGPPANPPTPAGTYNVKVTAQYSNGVIATSQSTIMVLTVK